MKASGLAIPGPDQGEADIDAIPARRPVLVGLIGSGIGASRSPALHEGEGAAQGLAYRYRLLDLDRLGLTPPALPELVKAARLSGFAGLNITHPCKQAILPVLDELSDTARTLGAVNTVVFAPDGRAIGHNTDCSGFAESFRRELGDAPRRRVLQLGAGGAGAAVAHALLALGVDDLVIIDTDESRAARLAADLSRRFGPDRATAMRDPAQGVAAADGLVNATPIGMSKHPGSPLDPMLLRASLWVADIIYFPLETELLLRARALGCRTMGGGGMVVFQAAEAFRLFTGVEPDVRRMLRHFREM
jgi:shikimate dehydrogenase